MMLNRRSLLKILPNLPFASLLAGKVASDNTTQRLISTDGQNIYATIGVRPLINARGTVTIVGATRILPEVQNAMDAATKHYVQLDELMEGVGQKLAELTGAEWGCVTSGASAAITLATLGCITRGDPDKLWQVPDLTGLRDEVIIPSYSRTAYECAARAVGVKMLEVTTLKELEAALGPRTAMILVLTGSQSNDGPLSLDKISAIAKPMGVPILADAAAEELLNPNPHLTKGADLVAYSGGKCLRGPQCAGLLLGRKDLVQSAWIAGAPHHGFGRGQKVGREEIMGMLTAVDMWFKRDHEQERITWNRWLKKIEDRIAPINGVSTSITQPGDQLSNRFPSLIVTWDVDIIPLTGYDVENLLWDGDPRIAVSGAGSYLPFPPNMEPNIRINPSQMKEEEIEILADKISELLSQQTQIPIAKKPAAAFDVSGQWDVWVQFAASEVLQSFVLEQTGNDLLGTHTATYTSRDLTGNLHGHKILIRSSYSREGVRLNFEFRGTITEHLMEGEVSLGEYGTAQWRALRHKYGDPD